MCADLSQAGPDSSLSDPQRHVPSNLVVLPQREHFADVGAADRVTRMASHAMDIEMHAQHHASLSGGENDAGGANESRDRVEAARLKHEGTER